MNSGRSVQEIVLSRVMEVASNRIEIMSNDAAIKMRLIDFSLDSLDYLELAMRIGEDLNTVVLVEELGQDMTVEELAKHLGQNLK